MDWTLRFARLAAAAALVTLVASLAPRAAEAQTISACYTNKNGTMYRVGATGLPADCTSTAHTKETWNVQGAPGVNGVSGYARKVQFTKLYVFNGPQKLSIQCSAGMVVLSANWGAVSMVGGLKIHYVGARLLPNGVPGYEFTFWNDNTTEQQIELSAICAYAK